MTTQRKKIYWKIDSITPLYRNHSKCDESLVTFYTDDGWRRMYVLAVKGNFHENHNVYKDYLKSEITTKGKKRCVAEPSNDVRAGILRKLRTINSKTNIRKNGGRMTTFFQLV